MTHQVYEEVGGPDIQVEKLDRVRSSATLKATRSSKPAAETSQAQQKVLRASFASSASKTAAKGKRRRVSQTGLGPGQYNANASSTKPRAISPLMSKTGRPDINKRVEYGAGDLGPGAYDGGKQIGKDVIGYSWGKPKPPKKVVDNRDYGYDPEKEFNQTRHKSPSVKISKTTPARPASFANQAQVEIAGPGEYKTYNNFGENVKGLTWAKPKEQKVEIDNRDYGYDPEREFSATRHRSPAAIISKSSPGRPKSFALDQGGAPGQYDAFKSFGQETKTMTFNR